MIEKMVRVGLEPVWELSLDLASVGLSDLEHAIECGTFDE
jgi:hypothetical protein